MAKLTLTDIASTNAQSIITAFNNNNTLIEAAIENTLSRDGTSPNSMSDDLDMNSNRIFNLPAAVDDTEPVRYAEFAALEESLSGAVADAQAAAAAAAASYDAFDDRYLGSYATPPTLDNDGNAILTGALYWDTASEELQVWNGAAWEDIASGGSGMADLVDDTSPELGGNLDPNGFSVGSASEADLVKLNAITVTAAEINDLSGISGNVQGQIDNLQPLDADLTSIAALTTTAYGRGLLESANAAGLVASIEGDIESAIDTLANLTSVQGLTVTLADAGADAILGWDDSAAAYENLTQAEVRAVAGLATTDSPEFAALNVGAASDTTITRVSAGVIAVEGSTILTAATGQPLDADLTAIAALTTTTAGRTALTVVDNALDQVLAWDDSAGTVKTMPLADITVEGAPATGDVLLIYGAEGDLRQVDWGDLPGAGGGISNVSEDASPTLGGNLDVSTFTVGDADAADLTKLSELTATSAELNFVDGVTSAIQTQLDAKQALDATLTALAAHNSDGFLVQTAADTFAARTLTGTGNQIDITNTQGIAGNPVFSLPSDLIIPSTITVPNTGLHILDTNASHDLIIAAGSNITADRTLTLTTGDANRTLSLSADFTLPADPGADRGLFWDESGNVTAFFTATNGLEFSTTNLQMTSNIRTRAIEIVIDGGGSAITTGVKGYLEIPFACTIARATALADQSGSIVVDIWKDTYANYPPTDADTITASAPVTISSATKSQDATLTGWTTAIAAGDILGFNVDSITTCTRVTVSLMVTLV